MDPPGCARVLGVCEGRPGSASGRSLTSICCSAVSISGVLRTLHFTGAQQKCKSVSVRHETWLRPRLWSFLCRIDHQEL
jgi:hypothetical protein